MAAPAALTAELNAIQPLHGLGPQLIQGRNFEIMNEVLDALGQHLGLAFKVGLTDVRGEDFNKLCAGVVALGGASVTPMLLGFNLTTGQQFNALLTAIKAVNI